MIKRFATLLTAVAAVVLMAGGQAWAGPVTIHDDSKVLDAGRVTDAGNALPDPVQVFTTEKYADDNASFDREAQSHITGATDVVIAINTKSHHLAIRTGNNSHIRDTSAAGKAFGSAYGNGDYTGATVAALGSLNSAVGQGAPTKAPAHPPQAQHRGNQHSGFSLWGLLCPILFVVLIVGGIIALIRRRRGGDGGNSGGGGLFNRGGPQGGYGQPGYGQPGYGPGPYDQGYGQGYGGRPGMSPGMAGGLGAVGGVVGGGLLGYELGKMSGEHENHGDYERGYESGYQAGDDQPTNQDWGGGGGDSDFGGGGSDFGGSGGDFGGGSDSDF
ncbi:hypothetical protein [Nocardia aurantia]|uniref:TPM domain-containing protein n=1 Tax=Nocardia aurantia TaxID=2585199 RepID=A0A7K0DWD8_9NOCA|nr:hypothetical protein [Nocardia aurantia]MQY29908.1 hypothetical protein [Nocardia aurantia]